MKQTSVKRNNMKQTSMKRNSMKQTSMKQGLLAVATVFSLGLWADPTPAQTLPSGLRQGMPYAEARDILLDAGWQAQFFPASSESDNQEPDATMTYLIELGYSEVVSCSGTGLGLCAFEFVDAEGHQLSLSTTNNQPGEEPALFRWWLVQE
jgi:hypothetical protein